MDALERTIARWVKNSRGLDAKLFINGPAFAAYPTPTILVTSPDCGPSLSTFEINYTEDGDGLFPTLTWTLPPTINASDVVEYVLVVEDADAPLGSTPALHGAVYHIPTNKIEITQSDLERVRGQKGELKGGLQYAQTLTGAVYGAPRPLRGHGPHR
ncbi:hypothetical protein HK100_001024 [Physocladia obscura]|uniref:PEBP-like protein n=1 Tax=Physocladia obscura TaxID=109957 RepID=A0AAD5XKA7_9FUNG|nr:hypothetical protein HK100_001024 [Physocladia obscura]